MKRLALILVPTVAWADPPALPDPAVCSARSAMIAILAAQVPPQTKLAAMTDLTADGRRVEFFGNVAGARYTAIVSTLINGAVRDKSCSQIIGTTFADSLPVLPALPPQP